MTTLNIGAEASTSRTMWWTGWVLSGLLIAFMAFDVVLKLVDFSFVADTSRQLGLPVELDRLIGIVELVCLALYIWPRTAVLGAILLTAVFGGAIATHLRLLDPWFSHTLFGVYLARSTAIWQWSASLANQVKLALRTAR